MIETHRVDAVEWITLNAPAQHNAVDWAAIAAVQHFVELAGKDKDLRALVITGTGKSFCAGADLGDVSDNDWSNNPLTPLCDAIERCPLPVICAMNGGVYGGGVDIALSCDFRIGVDGMRMSIPAAKLGIHYPASGLARAIRILGLQRARRAFLCADQFADRQLLDIGFLDNLVAPESLVASAQSAASDFAGLAPLAVQGMKLTLNEIAKGEFADATVDARVNACYASADHREGLAAQKARRPAKFTGK